MQRTTTAAQRLIRSIAHVAALGSLAFAGAAPAFAQGGLLADLRVVNRTTGQIAPTYVRDGKVYVVGTPGERYAVQVNNRSAERILAVVSVDGVNVVTGETAAPYQNGYVLAAQQSYDIAGWRKNQNEIAAFYFTSLTDSYAGRTGRPANIGVIGLAVYREMPRPLPFPAPLAAPPASAKPRAQAHDSDSPIAGAPAESARGDAVRQERDETANAGDTVTRESPGRAQSGPSFDARRPAPAPRLPEKIGTGHGERERSTVTMVDFRRASSRPSEVLSIQYDTRANLVARGVIPGAPELVEPQPFPGMRFVPDPRG